MEIAALRRALKDGATILRKYSWGAMTNKSGKSRMRSVPAEKGKVMQYRKFIECLEQDSCPGELEPCLQALWYDATGEWDTAHEIVQQMDDVMAARIHAYLHRKEGDDQNSRYWHRRAGTVYPEDAGLDEEWDVLVRELVE